MSVNIKKVLRRSEDIRSISSDKETLRYEINVRASLTKCLENLRQAEAIIKTGDGHIGRTFGNIMSAANAEISAIEDPLFLTLRYNLLTIKKTTILDPKSTEFEMMFFYLKNHVIEFIRQLFAGQFDSAKVGVEIREERIEGK